MAAPKLSIIVPVYNTEKYLKQCMDSLTAQTFEDMEIIIVDDGSKAECAALCDEFAASDSRIKVIHKENGGLGYARNSGLEVACGDYVGFVDSDDYVDSDMYESLYKAAVENDADLVVSGFRFVGGNTFNQSGDEWEKHFFEQDTVFEGEEGIKTLLLGVVGALPHEEDDSRYGVSVCKNIYKRSVICDNKVDFFSERKIISEDTFFMVDYIKHVKCAVGLHSAFYCYRRNEGSLSKSYRSDRPEKVMFFLAELEKRLHDMLPEAEYRLYLDRLIQGYGRILCSQEIMYAHDNGIKFSLLRKRLAAICTEKIIASVLKTYPWYRLPKKQAAFAFAMKHRLYFLQKLMVLLRAR